MTELVVFEQNVPQRAQASNSFSGQMERRHGFVFFKLSEAASIQPHNGVDKPGC